MEWCIHAKAHIPIERISVDWMRGGNAHGDSLHLEWFEQTGHRIVPPEWATSARLSFFVHTREHDAFISVGSCTVAADIHGENRFILVEDQMDVPDNVPAPDIIITVNARNPGIVQLIYEYDEKLNEIYVERTRVTGAPPIEEKLSVDYRGFFLPIFGYCTAPIAKPPSHADFVTIYHYACMVERIDPEHFKSAEFVNKAAILARVCTFIALASKYRVDAVLRNSKTVTCDEYGNPYDGAGDDCEGCTKMCRDSFMWIREESIPELAALRDFANLYKFYAAIMQISDGSNCHAPAVMQHMAGILIRKDRTGPALFLEGAAMTHPLVIGTSPELPPHVERKLCRDPMNNTSGWYGDVHLLISSDEPVALSIQFAMKAQRIGIPLWRLLGDPRTCTLVDAPEYPGEIVEYVKRIQSTLSQVDLQRTLKLGPLKQITSGSTVKTTRRPKRTGPVPFFSAQIGNGPVLYYITN